MRIIAWPAFRNRLENPYNWLLYKNITTMGHEVVEFLPHRLILTDYDVWHIHWPDSQLNEPNLLSAWLRCQVLLKLLSVAHMRSAKVIWTVHNLQAHERLHPRLEEWFWQRFVPMVDGYICLSEASRIMAIRQFTELRSRPGFVIPLGHYRDVYGGDLSKDLARKRLGLPVEATVFLFLGQIRPYKNVPCLIRVFRESFDEKNLLIIAGKPNSAALSREVTQTAGEDPRVRLVMDFVSEDQVPLYFKGADIAVLPYSDILNSASAMLALSLGTPVLAPEKGSIGELRDTVGNAWMRTYEGELDGRILQDAKEWAVHGRRESTCGMDEFEWPAIARETIRVYERMCR